MLFAQITAYQTTLSVHASGDGLCARIYRIFSPQKPNFTRRGLTFGVVENFAMGAAGKHILVLVVNTTNNHPLWE